ncbi:MAG TPA: DNA mismatch repair protein MutS, partial [Oscillospiraceae bacterium]|nr:DNA mismatch repair protein MutS [Oscillospiraceae bacterium]
PAKFAQLSIVDGIYTRIGASDDLSAGQSTFMVEMTEVASILSNATSKSLIVFDEIGRGTSTYDGMSIARAVIEHTADPKKLGAKTLFATHYHELTELEGLLDGVKNYNIAVKKRGDDITFLRRIVRGGADGSYGIEVAKLAGVPNSVVNRARVVLKELEENEGVRIFVPDEDTVDTEDSAQLSFSAGAESLIIENLRKLDVNTLTPIEALGILYELVKEAEKLE